MKIAVVGATGAVAQTILRLLEERKLPVYSLVTCASRRGDAAVRFRGNALDVQPASGEALRGYDVVFFAGGEDASERYARALVENGSIVIDNSATFRMRLKSDRADEGKLPTCVANAAEKSACAVGDRFRLA